MWHAEGAQAVQYAANSQAWLPATALVLKLETQDRPSLLSLLLTSVHPLVSLSLWSCVPLPLSPVALPFSFTDFTVHAGAKMRIFFLFLMVGIESTVLPCKGTSSIPAPGVVVWCLLI